MPKKIYLIDWNNFIYRMFFALPEFSTKDWQIVNAVFGMAKFFVNQLASEKPDYVFFIRDAKGKNFRHDLYEDYKATRDRMPDNLRCQIDDIENMIKMMWVDIISINWYEADDVIWTLAEKYDWNMDYEVDILTWDKDLYSLVSKNIKIYDTMKKKKFWPEETREKFGIDSHMIIDYLAIVWDKSDNIPWITWFWPKKAIDLINIIWSIEDIYKLIDEEFLPFAKGVPEEWGGGIKKIEDWIKNILIDQYGEENTKKIFACFKWKTFEKLVNSKDDAFLSKKLATLDKTVKLEDFDLENFKFYPDELINSDIVKLFKDYEFNSLLWEEKKELKKWKDLWLKVKIIWDDKWLDELFKKITSKSIPSPLHFEVLPLTSKEEIKGRIVLDTETTSLNVIKAELVWISIYLDDDNIFYINKLHNWPQVTDEKLKEFLNKLFNLDILIIGHNIKYDLEIIELYLWTENNHEINKNKSDYNSELKVETSEDKWQMTLGL